MRRRRRLLALRALKLGDFLTGVPALRALRDAFPDHRLVLAAPSGLAPLAALAGVCDEFLACPGLVPLRCDRPDVAVDLHGRGPLSQPLLLATRPGRLVAFAHPDLPATRGGPEWRAGEHEVARWCRLLEESGIPADARRLAVPTPDRPVPSWVAGATVVHPGAASPARRWPPERFAAVAAAEARSGRGVVVTGSAAEGELARAVAAAAGVPDDRVLAGRTDLLGLVAVVAAAGRVVCGDTGVAHVATAVGTPSVVLFGPVPPAEWGPPAHHPHVALWSGRRGDPHGTRPDPGLLELGVADVLGALDRLAGGVPSHPAPPAAVVRPAAGGPVVEPVAS